MNSDKSFEIATYGFAHFLISEGKEKSFVKLLKSPNKDDDVDEKSEVLQSCKN